jgi:hypothetical protein
MPRGLVPDFDDIRHRVATRWRVLRPGPGEPSWPVASEQTHGRDRFFLSQKRRDSMKRMILAAALILPTAAMAQMQPGGMSGGSPGMQPEQQQMPQNMPQSSDPSSASSSSGSSSQSSDSGKHHHKHKKSDSDSSGSSAPK